MSTEQTTTRAPLTFWKVFLLSLIVYGGAAPLVFFTLFGWGYIQWAMLAVLAMVLLIIPVANKYPIHGRSALGLIMGLIAGGVIFIAVFLYFLMSALEQMPR
ncbi:hypothetical protein [Dyella tabacisoli]|nr:hypothetical protein [Dyella tabacisoli]